MEMAKYPVFNIELTQNPKSDYTILTINSGVVKLWSKWASNRERLGQLLLHHVVFKVRHLSVPPGIQLNIRATRKELLVSAVIS